MNIEHIRTGDIILTSGSSELSKLIQKFQKIENKKYGMFSHSGIACWIYDTLYIIEAQKHGICVTNFLKHYDNDNYKAIMCLTPKHIINEKNITRIMLPYCGTTRYDYKNLLLEQPIKILTGKWIGEKKQNEKTFICHEFSAHIYNEYFEQYGELIFKNETEVNAIDICTNAFFEHKAIKY